MKLRGILFKTFLILLVMISYKPAFSRTSMEKVQELALPEEIDETLFGCGPLVHPGKTYLVSPVGNDAADGLTWNTSWRTLGYAVTQLKPGDTLIIGEGKYTEPGLLISCSGEKGRPVTIAAAPGHRVILNSAEYPAPLEKTPGTRFTYEVSHKLPRAPYRPTVEVSGIWEEPAFIKLENAGSAERVDQLPGTFHYDEEEDRLYVRFSNSRGPEANRLAVVARPVVMGVSHGRRDIYKEGRAGVELTGSYVHIKNINFRYGFAALAVFDGSNNTIENCSFFATELAGLILWRDAVWNLVKNNYGVRNGIRGGILINKTGGTRHADSDNLFKGNHMDSSAPTLRTAGVHVYSAIRTYGWPGPRNHFINNIMNEPGRNAFYGRGAPFQSVLQGNVITGSLGLIDWYREHPEDGSERIIIRNNTVLGNITASTFSKPPSGIKENWAAKDIAFFNNIELNYDNQRIEEARFADPSYLDYRLQADSPFRGKGSGGRDPGAYFKHSGSIYYVSPDGSDNAPGNSGRKALKTLSAASGKLRAGDTLYIATGTYPETLAVSVQGTPEKPVVIRAYRKERVNVGGIILKGSHIEIEGFSVTGSKGDAITVQGENITVKNCLAAGNSGAAVRGIDAKKMEVYHSTLADNMAGIILEPGSTGSSVRDNIFAGNKEDNVRVPPGPEKGCMFSHNAYHLPSANSIPEEEWPVIKGDLKFVDRENGDYRVWDDSPAAHTGLYALAAGAFPAAARPPVIESLRTTALKDTSATVAWNTPFDDTIGRVYYRRKGAADWGFASQPEYGTLHAASLGNLKPGSEYEFKVETSGRRGGTSSSETVSFTTSAQQAEPLTFYVSSGGSDTADGLTPASAWKTLRKANMEAGPGDTVLVSPGEYFNPLAPVSSGSEGRHITYRKHGEGEAVINGLNSMLPLISLHSRHYITIDGFTFTDVPDLGDGVIGISSSSNVEILNCRIGHRQPLRGAFIKGAFVRGAPNLHIEGNIFWGARYHLEVWGDSPGLVIKNNTFVRGDVCSIRIYGDIDAKIFNNIFYLPTTQVNNAALLIQLVKKDNLESGHNLFYLGKRTDGTVIGKIIELEGKKYSTVKEWQEDTGLGKNSLEADPLFEDAGKGDFRIKSESPALKTGKGGKNIGDTGSAM